jgi:hypothetical protein
LGVLHGFKAIGGRARRQLVARGCCRKVNFLGSGLSWQELGRGWLTTPAVALYLGLRFKQGNIKLFLNYDEQAKIQKTTV